MSSTSKNPTTRGELPESSSLSPNGWIKYYPSQLLAHECPAVRIVAYVPYT
jgi:hypothetical protein